MSALSATATEGKEIRIFLDGAFDMMHFGHMNAFRLGRSLGTKLVVGVCGDGSISTCKGPPIMNDAERLGAVEGCRWVDEVIADVPYFIEQDYFQYIIKEHNIDFVVHGTDPCIYNGVDCYALAKSQGKFKAIPRTDGISTTDIVGRMLLLTRTHHDQSPSVSTRKTLLPCPPTCPGLHTTKDAPPPALAASLDFSCHYVLASSKEDTAKYFEFVPSMLTFLPHFSASIVPACSGQRIVYLAGSWDMFHVGHISTLKKAREFGDYVLVGVHSDCDVNAQRGENFPILSHHERVLSVLGCKWVDNVLINAPLMISQQLVRELGISAVVKGSVEEGILELNPYEYAHKTNILKSVESDYHLTVGSVSDRICSNYQKIQKRNVEKKKAEEIFYANRVAIENATGVSMDA